MLMSTTQPEISYTANNMTTDQSDFSSKAAYLRDPLFIHGSLYIYLLSLYYTQTNALLIFTNNMFFCEDVAHRYPNLVGMVKVKSIDLAVNTKSGESMTFDDRQ